MKIEKYCKLWKLGVMKKTFAIMLNSELNMTWGSRAPAQGAGQAPPGVGRTRGPDGKPVRGRAGAGLGPGRG